MSDAWSSLLGAVIGGLLVLGGDGLRRRSERREAARQRLFEVSIALSAAYNTIAGSLIDQHDRGVPRGRLKLPDTNRYEVSTRFWATPGCAPLSSEANRLAETWRTLVVSYEDAQAWPDAFEAHVAAVRDFERAIRRTMGDAGAPLVT